ncbi:glycosyltransferase family 4 protein [Pontibacter sp. Tf4]|uniref:glycosyltransferase family 4 protein n=1 Tax=Pontibacter sp. Tf4 TaxID=2761620 RepID=UPI00162A0612|nr:glycosyltransferase family 1 protein [Pontibacter sp. Tf4]MBB6610325.1 glycosyltransferase family 4 protein [Pontibacter sp. Tf4]
MGKSRIDIAFFFRKPRRGAYSIESLFHNVQQGLGNSTTYVNHFLSYDSKGFVNRLKLVLEAFNKRGKINHVTGDVNFITLLLPASNTILTIHDVESLVRENGISNFILNFFWLKWPIARVKYVTVISEATKASLVNLLPSSAEKVVVIPNIISDKFQFIPKAAILSKPVILQVGTKYNKNIERTIEAIAGIDCLFIIVGSLSDDHKNLLNRHQIDYQNMVDITEEELRVLYIKADVVTFVSLFEGFGMPILEAQATGRPVITSNCSSMPEVAGEGGGLFVDPNNVDEIREAVLKVLNDAQLREELVARGLENSKRYCKEVVAKQYLDLYQKLG